MTNQEDKWDTATIYGVLWCGVVILFFRGDYGWAVLGSIIYTTLFTFVAVLKPVREKYPYLTVYILLSFVYLFGVIYLFKLMDLNNLWRTLVTFPLTCFVYWFGTRKVRPILKENKNGSS